MPLLLGHFQFTLIHGLNVPGSYTALFLQRRALPPPPVTPAAGPCGCLASAPSLPSRRQLGLVGVFLLLLCGAGPPLFPSGVSGACRPGELISQCPIFLPFRACLGEGRLDVDSCYQFGEVFIIYSAIFLLCFSLLLLGVLRGVS